MTETVCDLFCGPGGMGMGFSRHFDIIHAIDNKPQAAQTYAANHPDTDVQLRDVCNISGTRGDYYGISGVIGGPPCQCWSKINVKKDPNDPRRMLIREFMRLVEEIRPKFFLVENVPFTPVTEKENAIRIAEKLNYTIHNLHLNAADYGSSQSRKRWILIGTHSTTWHQPPAKAPKTVRTAFSTLSSNWGFMRSKEVTVQKLAATKTDAWTPISNTRFNNAIRLSWDRPSPTVVNVKKVYLVHPFENRNISLAEAASLQGFPSDYRWIGTCTDIAKMIADSMPVELADAIAGGFA